MVFRVIAKRPASTIGKAVGYYGNTMRYEGDIFEIEKLGDFSERWMEWEGSGPHPIRMYHEGKEPGGKIFIASEIPKLKRAGWVDSPDKFGKGLRPMGVKVKILVRQFWLNHWKWIIGTIIAFVALVVSYIKG